MTTTSPQPSKSTINMRRIWLKVHRWIALSVGWLLALVGLVGAILVIAQPIDKWAHPEFFKAASHTGDASTTHAAFSLEAVRRQLYATYGKVSLTMKLARNADDTFSVAVRGESWNGTIYFDPATGQEQGRRGEYEGVVNVLFKFHSALFLKETGKIILAWIALAYLLLFISGVVLWWPKRWPPSFKIELRKGLLRGLFDMHRIGGAVLGLVIAVSVATGAYMAWRPLGDFVTVLTGNTPIKPPKVPKANGKVEALSLDELLVRAQTAFPDAPITSIQLPAENNKPLRIRFLLTDDPHPYGLSVVWLHPQTGAILAANRWNQMGPGATANSVVYPLHTGELGGPLLEAVVFISGLALGMLGITGIWLWWRRRT